MVFQQTHEEETMGDSKLGPPASPVRIQRRRVKGWRMPEGAVYVGRPSKWGNPFRATLDQFGCWTVLDDNAVDHRLSPNGWRTKREAALRAAQLFAREVELTPWPPLSDLRGRDLACWCPLVDGLGTRWPCHADVLLELANRAVQW